MEAATVASAETASAPPTAAPTTLRSAPSLLSVLGTQGQGLASRLQAAAQGAAQGAASGLQAAAADAQALARSSAAALSSLPGGILGAAGGAFGGAAALVAPAAPLAGAEEAALRGRELRASAEAANARWLSREVDYATSSADAYARTLREVALNKQALRP